MERPVADAAQRLRGKAAAITGAASGIGRETALAFAREGASVLVADLEPRGLEETATTIEQAGGRVACQVGDVSKKADVEAMVDATVRAFGGIDVMHANAAVGIYDDLAGMSERDLDTVLAVNLKGPLLCAQAAIPPMIARGGGSIVFVSSVQGYVGLPGCSVYAAAKAALVAAARTLSAEVGRDGIRVNALVPGTIDTPMFRRDFQSEVGSMTVAEQEAFADRVRSAISLRRIGEPSEVADAAVFLAGDESSYVTGSALTVDGGFLAVKSF